MLKSYDDYICHFKYFLPRFQKSSCSVRILFDSEVLRTHRVPGWVTGHGETGPSDHPRPLVMEADGGVQAKTAALCCSRTGVLFVDVVWGLPRCVWARESTAPAQGNQ